MPTDTSYKWWVLAATSASLAMIFLDQSALPIALPSIQRELHLSPALLQWAVNAYLLALAVFIILGGKLGDKLGHRNVFQGGMALFVLSSILCAAAPTGTWLVTARFLQGVGGALMLPAASPLFRTIVKQNSDFGKMVGLYVSIASVFLIIGPTLGGFLTTYLSWRWIFWINLPIALISLLITTFMVPKDVKHPLHEKGFDWQGFISLSLFLGSLVFALMEAEVLGWGSVTILSCFAISLIALFIFIKVEKKHPTPFVDFSLFKNSCISRCVLVIMLMQVAYMSMIFWVIFLQNTLMLSPVKTSVYLLAAQIPIVFFATVAGRLLDHFGPRVPATLGSGMLTLSCLWMAIFSWQHNFIWLLPAFLLFGMSSPLVSISVMSSIVSSAPANKRGIASGVANAGRQIGGAVGLSILVALIINVTNHDMLTWLSGKTGALSHLRVHQLNALLTGIPLPTNLHLSAMETSAAHDAAIAAYTLGFSCAMFVVAAFCFASFWLATKLPNAPIQLVE